LQLLIVSAVVEGDTFFCCSSRQHLVKYTDLNCAYWRAYDGCVLLRNRAGQWLERWPDETQCRTAHSSL